MAYPNSRITSRPLLKEYCLRRLGHPVIEIKNENNVFDKGEILPIEDYVKFIVLNYQDKYPDTELSKKLGISRKSLWEKRKKYGLIKQK